MKAELEKLHAQVKKLPAREQEAVRLRYADGLNYKDMAAASNSSVEEVTGLLTSALNTLRGHKGRGDKSRYLAFVHGELNEADTQAMAELVEADPGARAEFESLLAISDALTDLYDALAEQSPKKKKKKAGVSTLESLRNAALNLKSGKGPAVGRPKLLLAGVFFAVAAAIVMFIFIDMTSGDEAAVDEGAPPAAEAAATPPAEPAPTAEPSAPPMSDEAAIAAAKAADAAHTPPADAPAAEAPTTFAPPDPAPLPEPTPPPAPAATAEAAPKGAAKGKKLMMVDAAKTVIPKNINKKTALAFFGKKLNKAPSCIPAADKKSKAIKAVIGVTKDGTYTQVNVQAPAAGKAAIAKCLKAKLGETAKSLRTTNKSGAKITLVLKVQ